MYTQGKRASYFLLFQSLYDCVVTKMDILALSVPGNGVFSWSTSQCQEIRGYAKSQFSSMHWAKQPCDCLIAEVKKQGIQQKRATITMETAL